MEFTVLLQDLAVALKDLESKKTAHAEASAAATTASQKARATYDAAVAKASDTLHSALNAANAATGDTGQALTKAVDTAQSLRVRFDEELAGVLPSNAGRVRQG